MVAAQVDYLAVRALGDKLLTFVTEKIDPLLKQIDGLNPLKPGEFDVGTELKTLVERRSGSLKTALTNIKTTLTDIGERLKKLADKYAQTEDDNTILASELDDLITKVKTTLPGIRL